MDVSSSSSSAISSAVQQDPMLGVQIKLFKSAQDTTQQTMDTLLSSIGSVQPAPSVEPHLGNKINVHA